MIIITQYLHYVCYSLQTSIEKSLKKEKFSYLKFLFWKFQTLVILVDKILISFHNMVYSQSFGNRANKSAAVKGLPISHKACPGVGKGIQSTNPYRRIHEISRLEEVWHQKITLWMTILITLWDPQVFGRSNLTFELKFLIGIFP